MAMSRLLLRVVRLFLLGIAFLLLLLGHTIPGWYNGESIKEDNMTRSQGPYASRRTGLWYADVCAGDNTNCSLYSLPLLEQSFHSERLAAFVKAWIPFQVIAVLVLIVCTSVMIRTLWEVKKKPSLSKQDLIAFIALLLAGIMGATIVLDIAIEQIYLATNRDDLILHFPFALVLFALGSYLTLAVSFLHAIDILLRIRTSFYQETVHQPQGVHALQIDISRSLRYFFTASKVILPIALVLLVLGIVTPRWKAYKTEGNVGFHPQYGIWYNVVNDVCCKLNLEQDVINAKVFSLIATVLTLLSVIVAMITTSMKQKHTHATFILVSLCLTLASASFSTWIAGFTIKDQVMDNDELEFPYSLFLFSFGAGLNGSMAIYQAVILFRILHSVTTLRDHDIVAILDNNAFELPDIHEETSETDEPPPYI